MRYTTMLLTSDGKLHHSLNKAQFHAEERFGAVVTKLTHDALRIEKYTPMCDFFENNLENFKELLALSADRTLENLPEDSEDDC